MKAIPDVTVVVLALDEEVRILPALEAARSCGYHVLVVDAGSTDGTVDVATRAGCEVRFHPWSGYAEQRNWAIDQVKSTYAFFVDADEQVHPALSDEVNAAVGRGVDAAWVPTLDYFAGRWLTHGGWYPQPHVRLVRRDACRFHGSVHESVRFTSGLPVVEHLEQPLLHRSHLTVGHYLRKLDRYTDLEAERLVGRPTGLIARGLLEAMAVIGRRMIVQAGWRDGVHGWIGAGLYATYRFTMYAKAATNTPVDPPTMEAALRRLSRRRRRRQ